MTFIRFFLFQRLPTLIFFTQDIYMQGPAAQGDKHHDAQGVTARRHALHL